jgi:hypothetical protein
VGVIYSADRMAEQIMEGLAIGLCGREDNDSPPVARFVGCTLMAAANSLILDNDAMQIAHALNSARYFAKLGHCQGLGFSLAPTSQRYCRASVVRCEPRM